MRDEIKAVLALGRLPDEQSASEESLRVLQAAIAAIPEPVSLAEARALTTLFGPDDCYGLAWTLLHKIETCGMAVVEHEPPSTDEWLHHLWQSWRNRSMLE